MLFHLIYSTGKVNNVSFESSALDMGRHIESLPSKNILVILHTTSSPQLTPRSLLGSESGAKFRVCAVVLTFSIVWS